MSKRDFDFLMGYWRVHNKCLKEKLQGSFEWIEFEGFSDVKSLLNGMGNLDQFSAERDGVSIAGISLRLFNPASGEWSIYWADSVRAGVLQPPMVGRFEGLSGEFLGAEEVGGKPVLCRFRWDSAPASPRWEQAFSPDGGQNWETNWIMTFSRA
jgi:hypothetical protein